MRVSERGNPAPFSYQRGPLGCLLVHGFPASPAEMRPLGQYLAEREISVFAPLLPGFGTIPEDLHRVSWHDWAAAAEAGLYHLLGHCSTLFVCGLSMGGVLSLYLAAQHDGSARALARTPHPYPLAGVIALAPAIRPRDRRFEWVHWLRFVRQWNEPNLKPDHIADPQARALGWHYRRVPLDAVGQVLNLVRATRRALRQIHLPTLIVQSPRDSLLIPEGARWAYQRIPAADKTLVWLERSGHNIALDAEREEVFEQIYRFIVRVAGVPPHGER